MSRPGRTLCLIPAKGASVRLPRKNIRKLAGKTLLEWTVDCAREAGLFQRISVSTEDTEVAGEAVRLGIEVPFMRPDSLARDPAGVVDVCLHALDEWQARGEIFDTLVILLPTSPFRRAVDVTGGMERYLETGVDFLMSVGREEHSPLSSLIMKDGLLTPLHPEWLNRTGSKAPADIPVLVRANGAVTIVDIPRFREEKNYYGYPLAAYEMTWQYSVDVDTEKDFAMAEWVAEHVLKL
jgi:CMP-N-acetylneuraminic acid synthetase